MMLVGEGAERFARANGFALCNPAELVSDAERDAWRLCSQDKHAAAHHRGHEQGTVGAVAIDSQGTLFAATSTGGTCCKLPGRVGDSPLIGCGCYADSTAGGASCTGYGEAIMKIVMAKTATDLLSSARNAFCLSESSRDSSSPVPHSCAADAAMHAAREAVHLLGKRTHATGGLILLDPEGNPGYAFNTPRTRRMVSLLRTVPSSPLSSSSSTIDPGAVQEISRAKLPRSLIRHGGGCLWVPTRGPRAAHTDFAPSSVLIASSIIRPGVALPPWRLPAVAGRGQASRCSTCCGPDAWPVYSGTDKEMKTPAMQEK